MFQFLKGLGGTLKIALLLGIIGLICWGSYRGVQHLFLGNDKYVLQEIELKTNGKLDHSRVVSTAQIDLDANIFTIDLEDLKKRLNDLPEVTSCDVERHLPGKLRITITERVPVAWIEAPNLQIPGRAKGGILADAKGITFPCADSLWASAETLPVIVIHGAKQDTFEHGSKMKQPDIMRAIDLLESFAIENVRAQWIPERITLLNSYSMQATCNDGSKAVFGMYDHKRQLSDFVSIHEHTIKTGREVRHVNLIPKINIPVKFHDDKAILIKPKQPPIYPTDLNNQDEREIQSILGRN